MFCFLCMICVCTLLCIWSQKKTVILLFLLHQTHVCSVKGLIEGLWQLLILKLSNYQHKIIPKSFNHQWVSVWSMKEKAKIISPPKQLRSLICLLSRLLSQTIMTYNYLQFVNMLEIVNSAVKCVRKKLFLSSILKCKNLCISFT